jgi:MinD superfamily P-loop ATPase
MADNILFYDAYLKIGEESATPLIKQVKEVYKGSRTIIIDSPPGTSCSMFEAVKDSDYCILVTESTPFGLNDLKLAVNVLIQIGVPFGIVINKYDESFTKLEEYINGNDLNLLLKIPFRMDIAKCYSKGELPAAVTEDYRQMMVKLFAKVKKEIIEVKENA